jgi:parallel beta-helix repeat protein
MLPKLQTCLRYFTFVVPFFLYFSIPLFFNFSRVLAADYYVATNGSDSNNGKDINASFKTIQKAADTAASGDTVYVRGGTYNKCLQIDASGISFQPYNSEKPVIDGTNQSLLYSSAVVQINGSRTLFSGFAVTNGEGDGIIVGTQRTNTSSVTIENCDVSYNELDGIDVASSEDVVVQNCNIYENVQENDNPRGKMGEGGWDSGLSFTSGKNNKAIGNRVYLNNGEGILTWGTGDYPGTNGLEIRNNTVYDNWGVNIYLDGVTNIVIDRNLLYVSSNPPGDAANDPGNRRFPICIHTGKEDYASANPQNLSNVTITNNIALDCQVGFGFWYGAGGTGLKNFLVANNTFVVNADYGWMGIWANPGNHSGNVFKNNIIYQRGSDGMVNFANPGDTVFDNNCWFSSSGNANFTWGGTTYNYAEWRSTVKQDAHSNPNLINPNFTVGTGILPENYKLSASSPCVNAGATIASVTHDFDGNPRPWPAGGAYDIGAYEYGSSGAVTPTPVKVGDVNGDGKVNMVDIGFIVNAYGTPPGDTRADLNGDGTVNSIDIGIAVDNYGE